MTAAIKKNRLEWQETIPEGARLFITRGFTGVARPNQR